jgi:hypothetical protein
MIPPETTPTKGAVPPNDPAGTEPVAPGQSPSGVVPGVQLIGARLEAPDGREGRFASGESVVLRAVLFSEIDCADASMWIALADPAGRVVFATDTRHLGLDLKLAPGGSTEVTLRFPVNLAPGRFTVDLECRGGPPDRPACFLAREAVCGFEVHNPWLPEFAGIAFLPVQATAAEWRHAGNSSWMAPLPVGRTGATIEPRWGDDHDGTVHARPGALAELPVRVTNLSDQWIASKPPHPVMLSYHLHGADNEVMVYDGRRTRLESPIPPAGAAAQVMLADAPLLPGRYSLHLSLVQEGRFWFDGFPGNLPRKISLLVSA